MATSSQLEDQYAKQRATQPSFEKIQQEKETAAGLPQRRDVINNITRSILDSSKLLRNVEGDVASRARQLGGSVTEAVRNRLTTVQRQPIEQGLNDLSMQKAQEEVGMDQLTRSIAEQMGLVVNERFRGDEDFVRKIERQMQRESSAQQQQMERERLQQARELAELQANLERQRIARMSAAGSGFDLNKFLEGIQGAQQNMGSGLVGSGTGSMSSGYNPISGAVSGAKSGISKSINPQSIAKSIFNKLF